MVRPRAQAGTRLPIYITCVISSTCIKMVAVAPVVANATAGTDRTLDFPLSGV